MSEGWVGITLGRIAPAGYHTNPCDPSGKQDQSDVLAKDYPALQLTTELAQWPAGVGYRVATRSGHCRHGMGQAAHIARATLKRWQEVACRRDDTATKTIGGRVKAGVTVK